MPPIQSFGADVQVGDRFGDRTGGVVLRGMRVSAKASRVLSGHRGDLVLAARLRPAAILEIRVTTSRGRQSARPDRLTPDEALERIYSLANLCLMLPYQRPERPSLWRTGEEAGTLDLHRWANWKRPMTEAWHRSDSELQAWILRYLDRYGLSWTPPQSVPKP